MAGSGARAAPAASAACAGGRAGLQRHQAAAAAAVRALCDRARPYPARGLLLWHSTGSGKTCTAAAALDAAWGAPGDARRRRLVYVSTVVGLAANPPAHFHECARMLPRWRGAAAADVAAAYAERGVEFLSYSQLAHQLRLHRPRKARSAAEARAQRHHVAGALLVADEVHALQAPAAGQRRECEALLAFLRTAHDSRTADTKVLLMTATPGGTVAEVLALLNVVRPPGSRELGWAGGPAHPSRADAARRARGLVSYFNYSSDVTRFPRVAEVSHAAGLSVAQAVELARQARGRALRPPPRGAGADALRRVWLRERRYSNTMHEWPAGAPLDVFSAKLAALLRAVGRHADGKHLVYSAFGERRGYGGHGARAVVRALRERGGFAPHSGAAGLPPAERVALLGRGEPVAKLVAAFNEPRNARGAVLRVLVATHGFNEGLDLMGVRHVHVFEPLVSAADDAQLVGRGVRMCSHAQLEYPREWTVTVHRYTAEPPDVAADAAANAAAPRSRRGASGCGRSRAPAAWRRATAPPRRRESR